ncbi:MAG TPA: hypothetical protein VEP90_08735 [Methylomirabilota bacterium]|nr:hypothetical protein [Methylomirabilota bacterium]
MPCTGDGPSISYDAYAHDDIRRLKEKNDELTRMLCSLIRLLKQKVFPVSMLLDPEIEKWFVEHEKWDRSQGR